MQRQVYESRMRGEVPPEVLEDLGLLDLGGEPPLTILRTEPTDQPGLHGMLQRSRSLGWTCSRCARRRTSSRPARPEPCRWTLVTQARRHGHPEVRAERMDGTALGVVPVS
jgi:hypothetical protein